MADDNMDEHSAVQRKPVQVDLDTTGLLNFDFTPNLPSKFAESRSSNGLTNKSAGELTVVAGSSKVKSRSTSPAPPKIPERKTLKGVQFTDPPGVIIRTISTSGAVERGQEVISQNNAALRPNSDGSNNSDESVSYPEPKIPAPRLRRGSLVVEEEGGAKKSDLPSMVEEITKITEKIKEQAFISKSLPQKLEKKKTEKDTTEAIKEELTTTDNKSLPPPVKPRRNKRRAPPIPSRSVPTSDVESESGQSRHSEAETIIPKDARRPTTPQVTGNEIDLQKNIVDVKTKQTSCSSNCEYEDEGKSAVCVIRNSLSAEQNARILNWMSPSNNLSSLSTNNETISAPENTPAASSSEDNHERLISCISQVISEKLLSKIPQNISSELEAGIREDISSRLSAAIPIDLCNKLLPGDSSSFSEKDISNLSKTILQKLDLILVQERSGEQEITAPNVAPPPTATEKDKDTETELIDQSEIVVLPAALSRTIIMTETYSVEMGKRLDTYISQMLSRSPSKENIEQSSEDPIISSVGESGRDSSVNQKISTRDTQSQTPIILSELPTEKSENINTDTESIKEESPDQKNTRVLLQKTLDDPSATPPALVPQYSFSNFSLLARDGSTDESCTKFNLDSEDQANVVVENRKEEAAVEPTDGFGVFARKSTMIQVELSASYQEFSQLLSQVDKKIDIMDSHLVNITTARKRSPRPKKSVNKAVALFDTAKETLSNSPPQTAISTSKSAKNKGIIKGDPSKTHQNAAATSKVVKIVTPTPSNKIVISSTKVLLVGRKDVKNSAFNHRNSPHTNNFSPKVTETIQEYIQAIKKHGTREHGSSGLYKTQAPTPPKPPRNFVEENIRKVSTTYSKSKLFPQLVFDNKKKFVQLNERDPSQFVLRGYTKEEAAGTARRKDPIFTNEEEIREAVRAELAALLEFQSTSLKESLNTQSLINKPTTNVTVIKDTFRYLKSVNNVPKFNPSKSPYAPRS